MTPFEVGLVGIFLLIVFLLAGVHIGVVMAAVGFLGISYLNGWFAGLMVLKTVPFTTFANYSMSVVPLFILMGTVCFHTGISQELYHAVNKWIGHFKGGLAMATIGACAAFAALSGSSLATAATMGTVALPEMKRYKYSSRLATGCIAAGGSIGILIPPSVPLIVYGILANQSIGKLFMAGIIPGIHGSGLLHWDHLHHVQNQTLTRSQRARRPVLPKKLAHPNPPMWSLFCCLCWLSAVFIWAYSVPPKRPASAPAGR